MSEAATPPDAAGTADWIAGGNALQFQRCPACHHVWYFQRSFCPACGDRTPLSLHSAGRGTVHASTLVHRAPSEAFRALAPYRIVLVDLAEGFRVMAHGEPALVIGDAVRFGMRALAGRALPYFSKDEHAC
jgi:uncharacterized OB-fold protein